MNVRAVILRGNDQVCCKSTVLAINLDRESCGLTDHPMGLNAAVFRAWARLLFCSGDLFFID